MAVRIDSTDRITLGDVYQSLGASPLVSLGFREDNPNCLVAQAVNDALAGTAQEAGALLLTLFAPSLLPRSLPTFTAAWRNTL
ncbi:hypothetical protein [Rhodoferax sp.]|uniref:hypothetical protein n=1 Tax=Rhodoferax sp. TaxID=50421 RepID=UPI0025CDDD41|nr:hypothetical protein [Rhodoferax sp.]